MVLGYVLGTPFPKMMKILPLEKYIFHQLILFDNLMLKKKVKNVSFPSFVKQQHFKIMSYETRSSFHMKKCCIFGIQKLNTQRVDVQSPSKHGIISNDMI